MIRSMLAGVITKRGVPSGEKWQRLRAFQRAQVARPTARELAQVLISRLAGRGPDDGLPSPDAVLIATTGDEAKRFGIAEGHPLPRTLVTKVLRCVDMPVEQLVEKRIIKSSETLARVIPRISAQVNAACIGDPDLRRLFGAIDMAFRRRRSLLLLNLERQVKLEDLPWVRAIAGQRVSQLEAREQARQTLEQMVTLSVTTFPHVIFPNRLLRELRTLIDSAGLKLPIVARHCFEWTCRCLQYKFREWRPRLQSVKQGAYAWRQMVFFLALSSSGEQIEFHSWASGHLAKQSPDFSSRFAPAVTGLRLAIEGRSPEDGGRRYLGWATDRHWLLG